MAAGEAPVGGTDGDAAAVPEGSRHDRTISIIEAILLATVTIVAAWSGYSSATWSTASRVKLAQASTARTEASRANLEANATRNFDSSTFNAWFVAYVAGNQDAMTIAERRFRSEFKVAFDAWMATNPATNPQAPPGPTYMPEYRLAEAEKADQLDAEGERLFAEGSTAGGNADDYVRITVVLASVLFLVGISSHFRFRVVRIGLVVTGAVVLAFAAALVLQAPRPPG